MGEIRFVGTGETYGYPYLVCKKLPYFFGYKAEFFPSKSVPKSRSIIDSSRFLGLFRKGKTSIIAKFHRTDLVLCSHSRERKTDLIAK